MLECQPLAGLAMTQSERLFLCLGFSFMFLENVIVTTLYNLSGCMDISIMLAS